MNKSAMSFKMRNLVGRMSNMAATTLRGDSSMSPKDLVICKLEAGGLAPGGGSVLIRSKFLLSTGHDLDCAELTYEQIIMFSTQPEFFVFGVIY